MFHLLFVKNLTANLLLAQYSRMIIFHLFVQFNGEMHVIFIVTHPRSPGMDETQRRQRFTDIKVISTDWWKCVNNAVSEHRLCRPTRGQIERATDSRGGKSLTRLSVSAHATRVSAWQLTLSLPRLHHYRTVNCSDRRAADTVPQQEACPEEEEETVFGVFISMN